MKTITAQPPRPRPQQGFTLLEVLIALVVLSVGLLGIAGLQTSGMRFNYTANVEGTAAMLAQNMADRMRANSGGGTGGQSATGATGSTGSGGTSTAAQAGGVVLGYYDNTSSGPGTAPTACTSSSCTSQQVAQQDIYQWYQLLASSLPSGTGSIQCITPTYCDNSQTAAQAMYEVTICWDNGLVTPTAGCGVAKNGTTPTGLTADQYYQITFQPVIP